MTMLPGAPPSIGRRATALVISALVAVVEITTVSVGAEMLTSPGFRTGYSIGPILWFLPLYLFFGSVIAIPLCLAVGLPLWHLAAWAGRQSRRDAIRVGLAAGAIIGGFSIVLLHAGSRQSLATALPLHIVFCVAGISAGWTAHRIGYHRR